MDDGDFRLAEANSTRRCAARCADGAIDRINSAAKDRLGQRSRRRGRVRSDYISGRHGRVFGKALEDVGRRNSEQNDSSE